MFQLQKRRQMAVVAANAMASEQQKEKKLNNRKQVLGDRENELKAVDARIEQLIMGHRAQNDDKPKAAIEPFNVRFEIFKISEITCVVLVLQYLAAAGCSRG